MKKVKIGWTICDSTQTQTSWFFPFQNIAIDIGESIY